VRHHSTGHRPDHHDDHLPLLQRQSLGSSSTPQTWRVSPRIAHDHAALGLPDAPATSSHGVKRNPASGPALTVRATGLSCFAALSSLRRCLTDQSQEMLDAGPRFRRGPGVHDLSLLGVVNRPVAR
jgi:hypothetical protein